MQLIQKEITACTPLNVQEFETLVDTLIFIIL